MNKKLISLMLAGAGLAAMSSSASAVNLPFVFDPAGFGVAPITGVSDGDANEAFRADTLSGVQSGRITLHNDGSNTISESGWIRFNAATLGGLDPVDADLLTAMSPGLNLTYWLYATFQITGTLFSGTFGALGSTYTINTLSFELFGDTNLNTFVAATTPAIAATVTDGDASAKLLATNIFQPPGLPTTGHGVLNAGGAALNAATGFTLTSPAGTSTFIDPVPFYNLSFDAFNNNTSNISCSWSLANPAACGSTALDAGDNYLSIKTGIGDLSFIGYIPEPFTACSVGHWFDWHGCRQASRKSLNL